MDRPTSRGPLDNVNQDQDYPDIPVEQSQAEAEAIQLAQATTNSPVDETRVTLTFTATAGGRIELPAEISTDKIIKAGDNFYLVQPNGDLVKIIDGAVVQFTLVVGGVTYSVADGAVTASPIDQSKVTETFEATPGAKIVLPDGVTADRIIKLGDNIFFVQPDGSLVLIVNGATIPFTLVVAGIEIPPGAITQAVQGALDGVPTAGPEVGGPNLSSGNTFEDPVGDLGPGLELVPLLPPEALQFFVPVFDDREEPFQEDEEVAAGGLPPSIGSPQPGFVEEDDLGNTIPDRDHY